MPVKMSEMFAKKSARIIKKSTNEIWNKKVTPKQVKAGMRALTHLLSGEISLRQMAPLKDSVWSHVKPTEITGPSDYQVIHEQVYAVEQGWA